MTVTAESLWRQLSADLRGFLRARVGDDATAEDLLQDVFVRIHERLDQLSDADRVASWVYRIARNRVADHFRGQAGAEAVPLGDLVIADDRDEPEDRSDEKILGAWLMVAIDRLPETYRDAVRLAEVEGVPQTEIARRLGLSPSGAKSRVQRGRAQLRAMLHRCCIVERDRRGNVLDVTSRNPCC